MLSPSSLYDACPGYVGSPAYIAPEVLAETAKYSEKADVFSFGVILWSMAQHLYLATHKDLYSSKEQHRFLMRPYGGKLPTTVSVTVVRHCSASVGMTAVVTRAVAVFLWLSATPDWSALNVLKKVIDGARPTPPPPQFPMATVFLDMMVRCWDSDAEARPSFEQVACALFTALPRARTSCSTLSGWGSTCNLRGFFCRVPTTVVFPSDFESPGDADD